MKTKLSGIIGSISLCLVVFLYTGICQANPEKVIFKAPLVYQLDITSENGEIYQVDRVIETEGQLISITANWTFKGEVRLEVSADNGLHYTTVVNGVPLQAAGYKLQATGFTTVIASPEGAKQSQKREFVSGNQIKWRARLGSDSGLYEVKIAYTDTSGVAATFGEPELSGFKYRKPIYIKGSDEELFNYQMRIVVGEIATPAFGGLAMTQNPSLRGTARRSRSRTEAISVHCSGKVKSDFSDIRFTAADGETLLPYYVENVSAEGTAYFWVKIPQLPQAGAVIYIYYGNPDAESLSNGEAVFDFFDDFSSPSLRGAEGAEAIPDPEKWEINLELEGNCSLSSSRLKLDSAEITSRAYQVEDGIIEYKIEPVSGYEAWLTIRGREQGSGQVAYSSSYEDAEHCIAVANIVKVNDPQGISGDSEYFCRVIANGTDITFERYEIAAPLTLKYQGLAMTEEDPSLRGASVASDEAISPQASVTFQDYGGVREGYLGLKAGTGNITYYDWIRVRKYADPEPGIDTLRIVSEEKPDLPLFTGLTIAENGDLVLEDEYTEGSYVSKLLSAPFSVRVIVPGCSQPTAHSPQLTAQKAEITLDISTDGGKTYKTGCSSDAYYYASRGDFASGSNLKYRLTLAKISVQELSIDYAPGKILVIAPNGGEVWEQGITETILWSALDYEESYKMKIEYSLNSGASYYTIAKTAPNTGAFSWNIPFDLGPSSRAIIRVSDADEASVYGASYGTFEINAGSSSSLPGTPKFRGTEAISEEEAEEAAEEQPSLRGAEGDEAISLEGLLETGQRPGTQLYDLLIKLGDSHHPDPEEDSRGCFKHGDIVMVRPAGFIWSGKERENFLIIQAYLTKQEAGEIIRPKVISTADENGRVIRKTIKRRAKKIDVNKLGLSASDKNKGKINTIKSLLKNKPLVMKKVIEEK